MRRMESKSSGLRKRWERRWQRTEGADFCWDLTEAPSELVQVLPDSGLPTGAALDIGCGAGVVTAYLAQFFRASVGMDIAMAALRQASSKRGKQASFVQAEAPFFPFKEGSFALLFDRGCLHLIPGDSWPLYFREVERILTSGGVFQIYLRKYASALPAPIRLLNRIRILIRRRGRKRRGRPGFLSAPLLQRLAPAMEVLVVRDVPFRTPQGRVLTFSYAVLRKR
jgi:SAM-dependent methyltransferase